VIYYVDDHLGSSHLVTDSFGNVLREESRYPYGLERNVSDDSVTADYVYTGKEYDSETGLVYFGGRYYAPELGRWITPDPLFLEKEPKKIAEMPKELNLYAYVQGNPMSAVDRDGEATDFNIGVKPTYDQLPKWGELTREQRIVETVAIGVIGTVAAAPILAVGYAALAPLAGAAYLAGSTTVFGSLADSLGIATAYNVIDYAQQAVSGFNPTGFGEGKLGGTISVLSLDQNIAKHYGTSPMKAIAEKVMENPLYLMNPIGETIRESGVVEKGIHSIQNSFVNSMQQE